jgi:hypothetical protein
MINLPTESKPWFYVAGICGAVSVAGFLRQVFEPAVELRLHVAGPNGYVEASPLGLARAAGVSLPVYALASAMQSEEKTDRGRLAVGRAVWNAVRGQTDGIFTKLCPSGLLGRQTVNPYADTSRPPTARTLDLAVAVAAGRVPDFVEGAVQWDAPEAIDRNHRLYLQDPERYPKYRRSAAEVAARRVAGGAREVRLSDVPNTRFWSYV